MKCWVCHRDISRGNEDQKKATTYRYPDGHQEVECKSSQEVATPDPKRKLVKAAHFKCHQVEKKHAKLGPTGRLHGDLVPDQFNIDGMVYSREDVDSGRVTMEEAIAAGNRTRDIAKRAEDMQRENVAKGVYQQWNGDVIHAPPMHVDADGNVVETQLDEQHEMPDEEHDSGDWRTQDVHDVEDLPDPEVAL